MGTQPAPLGLWFPQEGCLGQGVCAAGSQGGHPRCALAPGPSVALDTACSSSLVALQNAYQAIRHGECPCAIVGGINILLKPNTSVQFLKLGMLSPEGSCKSFDESGEPAEGRGGGRGWRRSSWPQGLGSAEPLGLRCPLHAGNGYCRSEAVVVMLLTKKSLARRVYATILNAGINTDGCKEQGGCRPGPEGPGPGCYGRSLVGLRPGSSHRCDLPLRGGTGAAHPLPV